VSSLSRHSVVNVNGRVHLCDAVVDSRHADMEVRVHIGDRSGRRNGGLAASASERWPIRKGLHAHRSGSRRDSAARRALQQRSEQVAEQEYADLFTPDGVFTTDEFRGEKHRELYGTKGRVVGRAKLMELVHTEDFCLRPDPNQSARGRANRQVTAVAIEPSAEGATGTAPLGNGGRYEDVYVKTAAVWRFRSRTVFMPPARGVDPGGASSSR
jgi:hypothetical protein